ncbi:MAG: hypothetical protein COA58_06555 [Bacteroidetes bacterium]|nr:MAG: hypothetical protein COA58_06555 [Bacteroidota bacterium]
MKNISLVTLLFAAFFVSCSSNSKLNKREMKDFYVSIEKTPCYGKCPMYKMEINGLGEANLEAIRFMKNLGSSTSQLSADEMARVVVQSENTDWESYDDEYLTGYSDLPSTIVRFSKCEGDTSILRYESNKAPVEIRILVETLDSLRKVMVWKSDDFD